MSCRTADVSIIVDLHSEQALPLTVCPGRARKKDTTIILSDAHYLRKNIPHPLPGSKAINIASILIFFCVFLLFTTSVERKQLATIYLGLQVCMRHFQLNQYPVRPNDSVKKNEQRVGNWTNSCADRRRETEPRPRQYDHHLDSCSRVDKDPCSNKHYVQSNEYVLQI